MLRLAVAPDRTATALCDFIENTVTTGTLVVTDDWSAYASLRKRGYNHHAIAQCGDPDDPKPFFLSSTSFLPISRPG